MMRRKGFVAAMMAVAFTLTAQAQVTGDVVTCWLYFTKDIPFKASLYGLYVIIAIAGYRSWRRKMSLQPPSTTSQRRN